MVEPSFKKFILLFSAIFVNYWTMCCDDDLPDPAESGEEIAAQLEEAVDLLRSVAKELRGYDDL